MTCFYSEQQLIRWANYFFNADHDDIEEDDEDDADEYDGGIAYNSLH
jgi:hypothetical protein